MEGHSSTRAGLDLDQAPPPESVGPMALRPFIAAFVFRKISETTGLDGSPHQPCSTGRN
jgi:hypothetical protein